MNICVFCSASSLPEKYTAPAEELAQLLAKAGHTMIYGGSDYGLMKVMADAVQKEGGKVVGITIPIYHPNSRKNIDELIVAKTLGERKAVMLERSDAIIVLVGGIGTLDELTEILEFKKQNHHNKPIVVLNTDGFYDGLYAQLKRMADENLFTSEAKLTGKTLEQYIAFIDTPKQALALVGTESDDKQPVLEVSPKQETQLTK
jgi:uncharacterized protein (TIGR00730 family)